MLLLLLLHLAEWHYEDLYNAAVAARHRLAAAAAAACHAMLVAISQGTLPRNFCFFVCHCFELAPVDTNVASCRAPHFQHPHADPLPISNLCKSPTPQPLSNLPIPNPITHPYPSPSSPSPILKSHRPAAPSHLLLVCLDSMYCSLYEAEAGADVPSCLSVCLSPDFQSWRGLSFCPVCSLLGNVFSIFSYCSFDYHQVQRDVSSCRASGADPRSISSLLKPHKPASPTSPSQIPLPPHPPLPNPTPSTSLPSPSPIPLLP